MERKGKKQWKIYKLNMDIFEKELDILLDHLLEIQEKRKEVFTSRENEYEPAKK
jgi:hypothetical protein